jgi:hypothetical protein
MKKDHIRDYATEAFRYYAFLGMPHKEDLEQKYYDEAKQEYTRQYSEVKGTGISKPVEQMIMYAEDRVREKQAELWDILAVEKTLAQLHEWERQAVEIVYFEQSHRDIKKGEISERVVKASLYIPTCTATVYNYLRKARRIFAYERGLRI